MQLLLIFVAYHASLPSAESYWNSVLSNTPMPKTIQDSLLGKRRPRRYIFLTENDLKLGYKKSLYLMKSSNHANFLPQKVNDLDSSTSKNLTAAINLLLSQPTSQAAKDMRSTIHMCEASSPVGEDNSCATTLEAMLDFTTSRLGNNVEALISEADTEINVGLVCHLDTSRWSPEHSAFDVLNVKPGTIPICHIVPGDSIAWVPNQSSK
ncbi:hypothetical protein Leryth_001876 [Lithospermum erythrorhizon]|nr:hypothetical protein Leryth_001876 [Lithospermum erythrorhizon]